MKYYSEITKQLYSTPEALEAAEKEANEAAAAEEKKKAEKEARKKEVIDAYNKYVKLRNKFFKDYNASRITIKSNHPEADDEQLHNFLDDFFWNLENFSV